MIFKIKDKSYKLINSFKGDEDETDILITMFDENIGESTNEITKMIYNGLGKTFLDIRINKQNFKVSDVFTTSPGNLLFDCLFNCIIPTNYQQWKVLFNNLKESLNEYSKTNKLRSATMYFPTPPNNEIMLLMLECFENTTVKTIKILSINEKETKQIEDYLFFKSKTNMFGKLIDKIIYKISKIKLF